VAHPKTKNDLWVLPLDNDKKPVPFLSTKFNERQARFSPDGHWVAYTSDESGQDEVYVRSFSMNSAGTAVEAGGKWPISNGFGADPRWRGDGRELYYRSRGGGRLAVEIATNPAFRTGNPQPLGLLTFASWDSAADGRRFLSLANNSGPQSYTVVLNWQAGLKK
jgi:Tol biopolymer transport system component